MRFSQFVMLSSLPQHSRIAPLVSSNGDLLMRLLSVKGLVIILVITFLHNFAFNAGTFYLALYYQVHYFLSGPPHFSHALLIFDQATNGTSPVEAGMMLLPYSLGASLSSMPAAWFIGFWQHKNQDTSGQKWVIFAGLIISTSGFGGSRGFRLLPGNLFTGRVTESAARANFGVFAGCHSPHSWYRHRYALPCPLSSVY
jgi:hypothetical protein